MDLWRFLIVFRYSNNISGRNIAVYFLNSVLGGKIYGYTGFGLNRIKSVASVNRYFVDE